MFKYLFIADFFVLKTKKFSNCYLFSLLIDCNRLKKTLLIKKKLIL
jgi:hypothetical protein